MVDMMVVPGRGTVGRRTSIVILLCLAWSQVIMLSYRTGTFSCCAKLTSGKRCESMMMSYKYFVLIYSPRHSLDGNRRASIKSLKAGMLTLLSAIIMKGTCREEEGKTPVCDHGLSRGSLRAQPLLGFELRRVTVTIKNKKKAPDHPREHKKKKT